MKKITLILLVCAMSAFSKGDALSIWIMPNGANPQGILENLLKDFTKETNIDTRITVLDWGEAWTRIHDALEAGKGPDVLQLGTTWVPYYADKGWLKSLNPYYDELEMGRFLESSMVTTKILGDQNIVAVPWFIDSRVLLANKRVLDEVGIDPSEITNYKSFILALQKIKENYITTAEDIPVVPFAFPGKKDWNIPHNFAPWIWSEGGSILKTSEDEELVSNLMNSKTILGIRKYIGFVMDSLASSSSLQENTANVAQRFNNGEIAFIVGTSEIIMQTRISQEEGGLKESAIGVDGLYTLPIPAGSAGSVSFVGGSNLCIPKKINPPKNLARARAWRKRQEDAIKLLSFLTNPSSLEHYTGKIGFIPPDKDVLAKWSNDSLYMAVINGAANGRYYPPIAQWGEIEGILVEMFSEIWSLVDDTGYYTETEFYHIILKYHNMVNSKLNITQVGERVMTLDSFIKLVNSVNIKTSKDSDLNKTKNKVEIDESHNMEILAGIILLLLIIIMVIIIKISRMRKGL